MINSDVRWKAVVDYRSDHGTIDVVHYLEEISDLHQLVESGPHWDTIEKIEIIRVNHVDGHKLTIEQSRKL